MLNKCISCYFFYLSPRPPLGKKTPDRRLIGDRSVKLNEKKSEGEQEREIRSHFCWKNNINLQRR